MLSFSFFLHSHSLLILGFLHFSSHSLHFSSHSLFLFVFVRLGLLVLLLPVLLLLVLLVLEWFVLLLVLLGLLLLSQERVLGRWVLNQEAFGAAEEGMDLRQILDMLIPPEQIIVLQFLLISQIQQVVIEVREHEEICEAEVAAHEEGSALQVLLQMLYRKLATFRSYLPSFR